MMVLATLAGLALYEQARQISALARTDSAAAEHLPQQVLATQATTGQSQRDNLLKGMQRVQWTLGGLAAGSLVLAIWLVVLTRHVRHFHHSLAQANAQLETAVARRTEQLVWLANTDPLTGLKNRRGFTETAQAQLLQCQRYPQPIAALAIDIDHFKSINDRYGHHVGDQAIQRVTESIVHTLRASDIIGRVGGEEFAVLLTHTDAGAARISAERLRLAVESMKIGVLNAAPLRLTVSVGIALYQSKMTLDALLIHADMALYRAKNAGRNRVEMYESPSENTPD